MLPGFILRHEAGCRCCLCGNVKGSVLWDYARNEHKKCVCFGKFVDFAEKVAKKILEGNVSGDLDVPGAYPAPYYTPLGEDNQPVQFLKAKPETHLELCDSCGACARRCPMGAISFEDTSLVPGICIKCQACVKVCHTKAKHFTDKAFLSHVQMLANNYLRPAEGIFVV